jgi:TusA-related sulfurtransferase
VHRLRPGDHDGLRAGAGVAATARAQLDLRGVRCPLSWAKAKVRLDALARTDELELVLDDPQGARDIPRAAEAAGHHVVGVRADAGVWRITIEV